MELQIERNEVVVVVYNPLNGFIIVDCSDAQPLYKEEWSGTVPFLRCSVPKNPMEHTYYANMQVFLAAV